MFKTHLIALAAALMLVANGDSFAIDASENLVSAQMMMQLRPGMSKPEVLAIMGKPRIDQSSEGNRWDYVYQKQVDGKVIERRNVVLEFESHKLARVTSQIVNADNSQSSDSKNANGEATAMTLTMDSDIRSAENKTDLADATVAEQASVMGLKMERRIQIPYQPTGQEEFDMVPGSIVVEGDTMDFYLDRQMRSFGNASIKKDNQSIYGDKIEYDVQNDELHVVGNTRIEFDGMDIWGPELRMKLYDNVGEMREPTFKLDSEFTDIPGLNMSKDAIRREDNELTENLDNITSGNKDNTYYDPSLGKRTGQSRGSAKTVFFEGEDKKRLESASYTTCEVGQDDWYIKASELEIDDYTKTATAWNARVEFKGVPILYSPWMNFSFLNQRKTGFLAPTIGSTSRSGFEVLTPFYWNIAPNMDATLATRLLSKRGLQIQGEFRYMGESYTGSNNIEYLPSDIESAEERYYINLRHLQSFGNGWSGGYNLEKVSDDQYFSELSTRIVVTSRVNLAQRGFINYEDDVWSFNGIVQKYQSLTNRSSPYELMPQFTLQGNKDWGMSNANLYTQWSNFDRDENRPFTLVTPNNGLLITGVTGSRYTAYPSISLPMGKPYGYITPKIGVHHTSYSLENESFNLNGNLGNYESVDRTLPIFSMDGGLFFDRNVKIVNNQYKQTLEPRIFYVYVPYTDQSMIPIFDSFEADLNIGSLFLENQFAGNDRINDANQVTVAFTTRMIETSTGKQRLAATLGQRFYFSGQRVTIPGTPPRTDDTSDIVAAVSARLTNNWNVDLAWQYNTDRSTTVKSNIGARYNPEPGKILNLSYRYTEDRLEQVNVNGQWPLGNGWFGLGRWNYSLLEARPIEGLVGIEYDAGCWQARSVLQRVSTATADANYALFFQLSLGGLTSIGANPNRLLERGIPGYTSPNMIPNQTSPGIMPDQNQIYE